MARKNEKPPLRIQPTTLWEYPSQHYGSDLQGDPNYIGATPSYVIWNLLQRYTLPGDVVVDPFVGSGTTIDVANDLGRKPIGFDLVPRRPDIRQADARQLPLKPASVDFVFLDPPYGTHVDYSDDPHCIGKLDAADPAYYDAMDQALRQCVRVLRPNRFLGLYVSDSFVKGKGFYPIGFELFARLRQQLEPIDIISVVRHNKTLEMGNYRRAAEEGNFFLRGFNYLFVFYKPSKPGQAEPGRPVPPTRSAPKPVKKDWRGAHKRRGQGFAAKGDKAVPARKGKGRRGPRSQGGAHRA